MTLLDASVLAVYVIACLGLGLWVARHHAGASELLLGGRRLPGVLVLLSLLATELSAATFIGVPHAAFGGDWVYLQLAIGALAAKLVIARWVVPRYHALRVVTVYGFLESRFGPRARRASAVCFVAGRVLASGVRLFIAALAFAAVSGLAIEAAIATCGAVATLYTLVGGIRSVMWTDALQAFVFLAGATAMAWMLSAEQGGVAGVLQWAEAGARTQVFHLDPLFAWADTRPLGVALIGGFCLTLATHTTDQDMVQRLLTTRSGRSGGWALAASALLNFPVTLLFLFVGTGLAAHYASPSAGELADPSQVVPIFALTELPSGLRGLVFAGLFAAAMSSLDSAICAIAGTWAVDVQHAPADAAMLPRRVRRASAAAGAALVASALGMAAYHRSVFAETAAFGLVELALASMTILYGGLLGVFGVGLATRRPGADGSAVAGLAAGSAVGLLLFLHPVWLGETWIAWPWWIPLGALVAGGVVSLGRRPQHS